MSFLQKCYCISWFGWLRITHVLELLWWFGGYVSLQGRCRPVSLLPLSSVKRTEWSEVGVEF